MEAEKNKKVYDFIKGNFINFIILLTSLAYVFYNMVIIKRTDLSVWECIAKAGIGILVGFMIKQGLGENGFNYGYRSQIWHDSLTKYSQNCNMANPYIERVDNFYSCETIEKKKIYRRTNLMATRMKYDWFFDEDGFYKENEEQYNKLDRKQKRVLKKCIAVKIYNLNLFSEYENQIGADTRREKTDKDQRAKMFGKNGVAQVLTAIVGAYFVPMLTGWDWASFIAATIQVCIWLSCGITQLYTNYNYVVIEKTAKLTRKVELIVKFTRGCEQGKYLTDPYEKEKEEEKVNEQIETDPVPVVLDSSTDNIPDSEISFIPNYD